MAKTNKEYLTELQILADKHTSLKESCEGLLKEGDSIQDKVKGSERIFSITKTIDSIMVDMDLIADEYDQVLENYKNKK